MYDIPVVYTNHRIVELTLLCWLAVVRDYSDATSEVSEPIVFIWHYLLLDNLAEDFPGTQLIKFIMIIIIIILWYWLCWCGYVHMLSLFVHLVCVNVVLCYCFNRNIIRMDASHSILCIVCIVRCFCLSCANHFNSCSIDMYKYSTCSGTWCIVSVI